ncbi:DUF7226 domain-containing protein [Methanobrevibacter wolinii]|uniref:DUF7226 domain-containing protein n=1 Tax=Methanobrevibacter wolinii TaxID=190977 RepID=UPI000A8B6EF0|nr:hypothetical protein [Methanobrevibacter wolinii]
MLFGTEFITKKDNLFIIQRRFNGNLITFGSFDSLDEAIKKRDELDDNGWPVPLKINKNIIEKNIEKKDDSHFIVFREINGKKFTFGPYDSIKKARIAKSNLKSTGWETDLYHADTKYSKYITKENNNKFTVRRIINGKYVKFGSFDSLNDAIDCRDNLVLTNWGKYNLKPKDFTGKYITKVSKGYQIYKRINGELHYFGMYNTLDETINERNKLIENNWEINDFEDDENYCPEKYINYDGNYYIIEREVYNKLRVYGIFKNKEAALKERYRLIKEYWRSPYRIKSRKYPYGENIIPYDYLFNIEMEINNEIIEEGPFYTFNDVVKRCIELESTCKEEINNINNSDINENSNLDIKYSDIINIYDNVNLIPEPEIPFPQADVFDVFVNICIGLYEKKVLTKGEIMELFDIRPRQYNFYISAGEYLGLFKKFSLQITLSKKGFEVFSLNERDRNLKLVELILEHKPYYEVFTKYLEDKKVPSSQEIFKILKNIKIYNVKSDVTLKRRATSVRSWINWIINLYD